MQPSIRCSAPPTRPSSPRATSSTQSRSWTNASCSEAACAAMSVSASPRMVRWAARTRRSFTARTITQISAMTATPAAASATIPCVELRSSTGGRVLARSAGEDDREVGLVVVRDLLARHRLHTHLDRDVLAGRRLRGQRDAHGLLLAGGDLRDRLLELDRVAARPRRDGHAHVRLRTVALVHDLNVERDVVRELDGGRPTGRESYAAERDRPQPVAVQAWRGAAVGPADAR